MLVVHDSIRRQFGAAPALVRGVAVGDTDRAAVVADHVDLLGALLHHHHAGEDRLLWPVLQPRVPADLAATVARMERQHEGIAEAQESVTAARARLACGSRRVRPGGAGRGAGRTCSGGSPSTWPRRSSTSSRSRPAHDGGGVAAARRGGHRRACRRGSCPWSSGWSCTTPTRR